MEKMKNSTIPTSLALRCYDDAFAFALVALVAHFACSKLVHRYSDKSLRYGPTQQVFRQSGLVTFHVMGRTPVSIS